MTTINGIAAHLLAQRIPEDHAKREKFDESEQEGTAEEGIENLQRLFPSMTEYMAYQDTLPLVDQKVADTAGPKFGKNAHVSVS